MFKIIVGFLFFASALPLGGASAADRILYEKNSLYQYIVVSEDNKTGLRCIHNNEKRLKQGGMVLRFSGDGLFNSLLRS